MTALMLYLNRKSLFNIETLFSVVAAAVLDLGVLAVLASWIFFG